MATKTYDYSYDVTWKDKLLSITSDKGTESEAKSTISTDAVGNPLDYNGWTFTWEQGRQLAGMSGNGKPTLTFKYSDEGIRTQKTVNGVTTSYHLVGDKVTYEENGTDKIYYTYDSSDNLISMNLSTKNPDGTWTAGVEYYYVRNAQGDIIGLYDGNGTQVVSYSYDSWGKLISIKDGSDNDITNDTTSIGVKNPYRYRGYRYDNETSLYYLQSRYYNAEWCRFINADALGGSVGELLSHNVFDYCKNNTVNLSDPSGYLAEFDWNREGKYTKSTLGDAIDSVATFGFFFCAIAELLMGNPAGVEAYVEKDLEIETLAPKAVQAGQKSQKLSNKIINGLKNADIKTKVNKITGVEEPYYKEFKLDDTYKVQLRRDVGEGFNHGDPNHWNLELRTLKGNLRYDLHLYVDENIKIFDIGEYIPKK